MKIKFSIWYMKPDWIREGIFGQRPDPVALSKTHVHLKDLELEGRGRKPEDLLNNIYETMQGEVWSPNGEARSLIESKNLQHTSMSVGDVIIVLDDNSRWDKMFMVDIKGFELLAFMNVTDE